MLCIAPGPHVVYRGPLVGIGGHLLCIVFMGRGEDLFVILSTTFGLGKREVIFMVHDCMFFSSDSTFTHKNILSALKDVVDWKSLGIQLNISLTKIEEIDINNRGQVADCRRHLIQFWLESDTSCSWKKLIDALSSCDHVVLAEQLKTKTLCTPVP